MKVQWTEEAKKRLEDIEVYIARENPKAAQKIILTIVRKTANQLSDYPASGKPGRLSGTRELFISGSPYVVVYTVQHNIVTILTVFHTAQDFPQKY